MWVAMAKVVWGRPNREEPRFWVYGTGCGTELCASSCEGVFFFLNEYISIPVAITLRVRV